MRSTSGPRVGFAWTVGDEQRAPSCAAAVGYLFSPHLPATVRQSVADPYVGFRVSCNRTEAVARNLGWPGYSDDFRDVVLADRRRTEDRLLGVRPGHLGAVHHSVDDQRPAEPRPTMAVEVGYIRTNGRELPLQRQFQQAFDRQTGARPNPLARRSRRLLRRQRPDAACTTACSRRSRKRFSSSYSFEVNYTLGKGVATQGGDLAAYYLRNIGNTQDFWDPELDRGPADNDVRHRRQRHVHLRGAGPAGRSRAAQRRPRRLADLRHSFTAQSGSALTMTQPSGIPDSRPDVVPGVDCWSPTGATPAVPPGATI